MSEKAREDPASARREDMPRVVLLTDDLLLRARLEPLVEAAGARPEVPPRSARTALAASPPPSAYVVDLTLRDPRAAETIAELRARHPGTPIVAFGPHTDRAALSEAMALGCHAALPRSRAVRELTAVLRGLLVPS